MTDGGASSLDALGEGPSLRARLSTVLRASAARERPVALQPTAAREFEAERARLAVDARRCLDAALGRLGVVGVAGWASPQSEDERVGLVLLRALRDRPALRVRNGLMETPPAPWGELLVTRDAIERAAAAVGRFELGEVSPLPIATGFLVAPDLVMTNRHVVSIFASSRDGHAWEIGEQHRVSVNWTAEDGGSGPTQTPVVAVVAVHPTDDVALVRIAPTPRSGTIVPLTFWEADSAPGSTHTICVIGHPIADRDAATPTGLVERVFRGVMGTKRVMPGELYPQLDLMGFCGHDASTIAGASGSPVLDPQSGSVLAVHSRGVWAKGNKAVALWRILDQPMFSWRRLTPAPAATTR
ncbi:MAG: serine protease [Deltaproteobacteria bacterium]|nr:serine protease [Myxococcales bacterium]MDP3219370.1 serine protease [Deltaproteobacteria bacterium]